MHSINFHFYNPKKYLYSKPVKGLQGYEVGYGFAFNGQEKDDEVSGVGNTMTAEFWEYDARLGRRWNLDPIPQINISDYVSFMNNPIFKIDVLGNKVKSNKDRVSASNKEGLNIEKDATESKEVKEYITKSELTLATSLSEKTGLQITFNKDGIMEYAKDKDGKALINEGVFSKDARNDLIKLIDDQDFQYDINWAMGSGTVDGGNSSERKSATDKEGKVNMDLTDFSSNHKFFDFGMVFLHEMNHGYYGLKDNSTCPEMTSDGTMVVNYGYRGETVIRVNKYEEQLNYPIRVSYCTLNGVVYFQKTLEIKKRNGQIKKEVSYIGVEF